MNPPRKNPALSSRRWLAIAVIAVAVGGWFAVAEFGTAWWYAKNEATLPRNDVPADGADVVARIQTYADRQGAFEVKVEPVAATAMEMLKCSFGETVSWQNTHAFAAASVLRWDERSAVAGTETMHNPGNCLRGAGWNILTKNDLGAMRFHDSVADVTEWDVEQSGIGMKAFIAVFRRFGEVEREQRDPRRYWNAARLDPVFDGKRDAPLMIVLVYLPIGFSDTDMAVRERFRAIMDSALNPETTASVSL